MTAYGGFTKMRHVESRQESRESLSPVKVAAEIHNYHHRAHDGGAAVYLPDTNTIVALGAERVNRIKHSPNSVVAYSFLRDRLGGAGYMFGGSKDRYDPAPDRFQPIHHHMAHAASTYYPSGFPDAAVLVVDDRGYYGDGYNSTTIWTGQGTQLTPLEMNTEKKFPTQSIGHLYSGVTDYLGFGFLEAGKTMGLAAYGRDSDVAEWFRAFVRVEPDGRYSIDPTLNLAMRYLYSSFDDERGNLPEKPVAETVEELLRVLGPQRKKEEPINEKHIQSAWAVQDVLEKIMFGLAKRAKELSGSNRLCLAGGVALNSVVNGKIARSGLFDEIFIQPAAGDDGQALGKLLYRLHNEYGIDRIPAMRNAYLGPQYTDDEVRAALELHSDSVEWEEPDTDTIIKTTAEALSNQQVVGWFQGGSEIGPRALGHRSILADPRPGWMRDHVNFDIKHREWFRPLAPSIPLEDASEYFDTITPSPFMLVVSNVRHEKRTVIPAVAHVDGSARLQTVTQEDNGTYHTLIKEFGRITGVPVVLNTSFNVAGEPIVETPDDAIRSFLGMKLDLLVLQNNIVRRR